MPQLIKADLSRWARTSVLVGIGKYALILTIPFAVLYAYAKVQSFQRQIAERRVEQLTNDVRSLSTSLAQAEHYIASARTRANDHVQRTTVLANEKADVLDMPAPDSVLAILRTVQDRSGEAGP